MKKSITYARGVKGDLDLGLTNSRVQGDLTRAWSRADFPGGRLPGQAVQELQEVSTTQRYRIGTRRVQDNRTFRYAYTAELLLGLARLVINSNFEGAVPGHVAEDGYEGVPAAQAAIGARFVDIADVALRAANFYQGGWLYIYGALKFHQHFIVASDAGTGAFVRCYLDDPISTEIVTVAMGVQATRSTYSAITPAGGGGVAAGFGSFVGLNLMPVAALRYFWLLTAGPCIVTPTAFPGTVASMRDVYANGADGTIQSQDVGAVFGHQRVGYLLAATSAAWGDLQIMLQLE